MKTTIEICMGSSCFARGNEQLLPLIEDYVSRNGLQDSVDLVGLRCQERCQEGPNLRIDGRLYQRLDRGTLLDVLDDHFAGRRETSNG